MGRNRVLSSQVFPLYAGILFLAFITYTTPALAASVIINESGPSTDVTEGGNPSTISDTYTVVLDTQPTGDVTIGVTSNNTSTGVTVDKSSLTFTNLDWNNPQTVMVTVVDDAIDEASPHTSTISHSISASADLINYPTSLSIPGVTANITDNDAPPTVSFTAANQSALENVGTMTVTVQLSSESGLPVTVPYTVSGTADSPEDYTISPASSVNIPAGNTTANITITVNNDGVDEANETVIITMGTPTNATKGTPDVHTATINDNDGPPTVSFTAASQSGPESVGTMTVTAELSSQSGLPVIVPYTVSGSASSPADYTISPPSSVTIASGSTTADITITVVNDGTNEANETVVITMDTPTNATEGTPNVHTATINDDDTPGVTITETGGNTRVTEGGPTDTYNVQLNSNPKNPVTITITPSNSQVTVNPSTLNISPGANATNPRPITVTAVDDAVAEGTHGSTIRHSASSIDTDYHEITIDDVTVTITDNESASVNVSPRTVDIVEGSGDDTYDIVLTSEPTAAVTVTVSPDSQATVNPSILNFSPGNGRSPQTVTVTAVDDNLDEGNHISTISHSAVSADPRYDGISILNVTANITDNETQSFVIDPIGSTDEPIIVPEGETTTFQVRLSAQPLSSITINATVARTSGDADITVQSGGTLSFNSTNWDVFQTVTLAAAEDPDGLSGIASISVDSPDVPIRIVTAQELDDDTISVITPNGAEVWIFGTTREILWSFSPDVTSTVSIELFRNNILELSIDSGTENDGAFTWDIPANLPIDFNYRIRITATSNPTISDDSDGDFSILSSDFDRDLDSIPDAEEMGPDGMDNFYDGNGDGIPDWNQSTTTSVNSFDASHYVTFEADGPISNMQPFPPPPDAPGGVSFPYGFFSFEFAASAPGDPATVTMFLDGEIPDTFWKFGATPDNFTPHFYEFLDDGETGAQIDGDNFTVKLLFVDGLRGDDDIQADAVIVDPGGPGVTDTVAPPGEALGSDCFIATAAFGSPSAPYVRLLREFRDRHLLTNGPGRWFVAKYYRHSPPYARWLSKHPAARALVRLLLTPLIVFTWILKSVPYIFPLMIVITISGMLMGRVRAGFPCQQSSEDVHEEK